MYPKFPDETNMENGRSVPLPSIVHDLRLYPLVSMPTAAQFLSSHPDLLSTLMVFLQRSANPNPSALPIPSITTRAQAANACRAGMQVRGAQTVGADAL